MRERWRESRRDEEKVLERPLACTVLEHVWKAAYIQIFRVRQINVRICFCLYKQIRVWQTCIGQGFIVAVCFYIPHKHIHELLLSTVNKKHVTFCGFRCSEWRADDGVQPFTVLKRNGREMSKANAKWTCNTTPGRECSIEQENVDK
jgi:hypothetical protein